MAPLEFRAILNREYSDVRVLYNFVTLRSAKFVFVFSVPMRFLQCVRDSAIGWSKLQDLVQKSVPYFFIYFIWQHCRC
jgi:hypothetical protein